MEKNVQLRNYEELIRNLCRVATNYAPLVTHSFEKTSAFGQSQAVIVFSFHETQFGEVNQMLDFLAEYWSEEGDISGGEIFTKGVAPFNCWTEQEIKGFGLNLNKTVFCAVFRNFDTNDEFSDIIGDINRLAVSLFAQLIKGAA